MTTTVPIWQRKPTSWKVADAYAQDWLAELAEKMPTAPFRYIAGGRPSGDPAGLSVEVFAHLDGFLVNAYGPPEPFFGPDVLPLGERGLGREVSFTLHPVDPGWEDQARPRLEAAVCDAVSFVTALHEGRQCAHEAHNKNGDNDLTLRCQRPTGHDAAGDAPGWWRNHARTQWVWDADGTVIR